MTPDATRRAVDLYTLARQTTDPDSLLAFANQDPFRLMGTTQLPWSVCLRLTQYARRRYWAALYTKAGKRTQARIERRQMVSHAAYFGRLKQRLERAQKQKRSAP